MISKELHEASPDSLPGSFTSDLMQSKQWLCNYLNILQKKYKDKFETITVLGSWFGNLGLLLDQNNIKFKNLVLVDKKIDNLNVTKTLVGNINKYKIFLLAQDANDHTYSKSPNQIIINTSCNDMNNEGWLTHIPNSCLVLLQARNNLKDVPIITNDIYDFDSKFSLTKTLVLKQLNLSDPTTKYSRFMKIGIK